MSSEWYGLSKFVSRKQWYQRRVRGGIMSLPQRIPIRLVVQGTATNLSAAVGEYIGSVIIFASSNNITGLDQISRIYYEDNPTRDVLPRQLIKAQDSGRTFVVEGTQFPLQNSLASPLITGECGIPYDFSIVSGKENGGRPSEVSVVGPDGEPIESSLIEEGSTYRVSFTPNQDGQLTANVTFTVTSSVTVSVAAMVPEPIKCVAYGPGLEGGEQYTPAVFTVEARNKLGQPVPFGGHPFVAKVKGPLGEDIPVEIVDNGDGTTTASYVPVSPGPHVVEVKLNDQHIKDSPFNVDIDYSSETANAGNSWADGPGIQDDVNKTRQPEPSTFTIHAVDKNGVPKTTGGDLFNVVIEDPLFDIVPSEVKDNNDGTYTVSYQAKEPGINRVSVFLRNKLKPMLYEHIKDSPMDVNIKCGTDPSKSTAEGPGLKDGIKDTFPAKFTVTARDRDGKPIPEGGDDFHVSVIDPDGEEVPAVVQDNGDGTYDVEYKPEKPGPHTVDVTLDNAHIRDCPRKVNVKAGAHASHTFIEKFDFLIRTRDKRGEDLSVGGMNVKTSITHLGTPIDTKQTDKADGTYLVEYTLPVPVGATYIICTEVDDNPIRGSPWEQRV
eukprot:TRINITY_DN1738_c0_g1_i5.p1 TRINITY_DN1738_c0_g1~~TRINITY_DN1738_c0_g1_i5.p1  ORF type:complete len:607 (+),score=135.06 TRINITY_DN1738_c0_g1_i5:1268-3088(+)